MEMILKLKAIVFMHRLRDGLQTVLQLHGFETMFIPCTKPSNPDNWRLLIYDGHGSHTTPEFRYIYFKNNIQVLYLTLLMLLISCNPWMFSNFWTTETFLEAKGISLLEYIYTLYTIVCSSVSLHRPIQMHGDKLLLKGISLMDSRRLVFILFNQIPYSTRFHSINCIDLSLFQILSFCLHNQLHLFDSLWLQLQIIVSFEARTRKSLLFVQISLSNEQTMRSFAKRIQYYASQKSPKHENGISIRKWGHEQIFMMKQQQIMRRKQR